MNGIIGKKIGMTQVFDEKGTQIPVTVIEAGPCSVLQIKTLEKDGYSAAQLSFGEQKEQRLTLPLKGHYKKASVKPGRVLREFSLDKNEEIKEGETVSVSAFKEVTYIDVSAISKGQGFQGVVKRFKFGGGRKSHGGHNLRGPGSVGQCVSPARIVKGRKMPGHMGNRRVTVQNLKVVNVSEEDHTILIKGAVPGPNGGFVEIRKAIKKE